MDLSHAVSGPTCTFQLAMLGAEVIKVERPGSGDPLRNYSEHAGDRGMASPFLTINAGKKSVVLDLGSPEGKETLRTLANEVDILIENFRPGVAARLGIDWDSLSAANPRLIYCAISGFGQEGPFRDRPAYDHIVQAMSGLMSVNGHPSDDPVMLGVPIADTFSGFMAVIAILSAVIQVRATGEGQRIDVSMLDSALTLLNQSVATYGLSGREPVRRGNQGFRLVPTADLFPTATLPIALGANDQGQFERLCAAIGASHLLDDKRFATFTARQQNAGALRDALISVLAKWDALELETSLATAAVPAGAVRGIAHILSEEHVRSRGLLQEAGVGASEDRVTLVGPGWRTTAEGPSIVGAVPSLGQHTAEVLETWRKR